MSPELQAFAARARLGPASPGLGVGVYARLLRGRVRSAFEELLPRSARLLGPGRVTQLVEDQLARGRATSPLFRTVAAELAERVALSAAADPAWPAEAPALAHYEWQRFAVASAERDTGPVLPLDGAHGVVFARAAALLRLPFRVQEPSCSPGDARLLLYRARSGALQVLELSEAAHRMLASLWDGASLAESIASMQVACGRDPALCHACATLLADLAEAGALRGRRSAAP